MLAPINRSSIEITHFVDPHLFWFKFAHDRNDQFAAFEVQLQRYAIDRSGKVSHIQRRRGIKADDIVLIRHSSHAAKWLWCVVESVDTLCSVWAIDYGFPAQVTLDSVILVEDDELSARNFDVLFQAAISTVMPANGVNDFLCFDLFCAKKNFPPNKGAMGAYCIHARRSSH